MEIEYKIKHLQMLIEDYQQKIKEYQCWKDHFAILQHQFQNKEEISVQHRIPKDYVQHLGLDTEKFTDMCKIEIARKIADHLIKSNSIEIIISENNIYGGNHYEIGCNFTFIP